MAKYFSITGMLVFFILGLFSLSFCDEQLTITTYYPSPYGSYLELTAQRMKIGTTYSGSAVTVNNNNLIVEGDVGIGTTSPAYKLDVAGDINTSGDVRHSGIAYTPDYVFESGYNLMSLDELKKFIFKNKHLPNMPSAQQIEKEGVKLFEQNRVMLEKLEESYLYIIKLEERIAKLETTLDSKRNTK